MSGPQRVRLFLALELPESVRHALANWRERAIGDDPAVRAVDPAQLHVTLCFLGWRAAGEVEQIWDAAQVISGQVAARLEVTGALWLPPRRARVLAVELADDRGALGRVQSQLAGALAAAGLYRPEKRPFLAHVTVARVRKGQRPRAHRLPPTPTRSLTASRVSLFRSRLAPGGARYEPLRTIALRDQ